MNRMLTVPVLAVLVGLMGAACTDSETSRPQAAREEQAATGSMPAITSAPAPIVVPAQIANRAGTVSTARYGGISVRSTADHPYGPLTAGGTVAGFTNRVELVRRARAAVVVEVLAISNPHFNSDDGGYWSSVEGGAAPAVVQDVRVSVLERWADRLNLPAEFDLTVVGGQVEVILNDEQAHAAELEKGGRFVIGSEPAVELTVGERALLFIARGGISWKEGGERQQALRVEGAFQGKFRVARDRVEHSRRPEWSGPAADLREEVGRELGKSAGQGT